MAECQRAVDVQWVFRRELCGWQGADEVGNDGCGGRSRLHQGMWWVQSVYFSPKDLCVCPPLGQGFPSAASPTFFTHLLPTVSPAGGRSAIASLLPTKTLAIGSETKPDQSGVPATVLNFCPRCSNLFCFVSMVVPQYFP